MSSKLRVEFATEEAFRREYANNISKGGIFVATRVALGVRDFVSVELVLATVGVTVTLPGEVVHCIPLELAATGAQPGVAIQFLLEAEQVRERLAPFAPASTKTLDELAYGTGRRAAPRSRLRVLVQVQIDGRWLDGRTRNVSSAGMLVTLGADPLPIGCRVRVSLAHPTSREEIEIDGVVTRHIEGAGETCLGVEFRIPETQRAAFDEFLARLQVTDHNRKLGGIHGPIDDLGTERLIRMFGSTAPEGTLTLSRGDEEGIVTIDHGKLWVALGSQSGDAALAALLAWQSGHFEFAARVEPGLAAGPVVTLPELFDEVDLTEVVAAVPASAPVPAPAFASLPGRARDDEIEWDDAEAWEERDAISGSEIAFDVAPIAEGATLSLTALARDDLPDDLSKTEQALLDLAGVGVRVGKAVDIIPEPARDVYAALSRLIAMGLVAVARAAPG